MARYVTKHWKAGFEGATRAERKGGPYRVYEPDMLCGRAFLLDGETAADVSDAEMAEATGKSMPTVNDAIRRLQEAGAVKQTNVGKRNRAFEAVGVIELFTNFERTLASIADDTAVAKPSRAVPFRPE